MRPFRHARYLPGAALAEHVEHYWVVEWSLEVPHVQQVATHPVVHLVHEGGTASLTGLTRTRFERRIEGQGRVFGVKLRPGAAGTLLGCAADYTDRRLPLTEVLPRFAAWVAAVAASPDDEARVAVSEDLLAFPPLTDEARLVVRIAEAAAADPSLTRADALAERFGIGLRRLQRLFHAHVGASPKWVLRRYRLHEVLARAEAGASLDWASVARSLGYFDQAHLIRDVRAQTGTTPTALG